MGHSLPQADENPTKAKGRSVAFVLPCLNDRCGVGDYSIRMAALLSRRGIKTTILVNDGARLGSNIVTPEGTVPVVRLSPESAAAHTRLAVQYVPGFSSAIREFHENLASIRHPRTYLMVHECWHHELHDSKLTLRQRLVVFRQKWLLGSIVRRLRPVALATSNEFYRMILRDAGFAAEVSPMPGNIPISTNPKCPELPGWWDDREKKTLILSFGSLYTDYWDPGELFRQAADLERASSEKIQWILAGRISKSDHENFQQAASRHGLGDSLWFTGQLEPEQIDWLMHQVDAYVSGTPGENWAKSGGILAAVERGLPVFLPRGWRIEKPEPGALVFRTLSEIIEFIDAKKRGDHCKFDSEPRTPDMIVERFCSMIDLPV